MSSFLLKLLAMLTMLVDHIGATMVPYGTTQWWICRIIGRVAFPIFCFCISQGLTHTHSRGKYLLRLLIFSLVSEIPFDLAFNGGWWSLSGQNVIFTFLFAAAGITVFELPALTGEKDRDDSAGAAGCMLLRVLGLICGAVLAYLFDTDYGYLGVLVVYAFYFGAKDSKALSLLLAGISVVVMSAGYYYRPGVGMAWNFFGLECCALAALIPIALYNGKLGPKLKWLFYVFYPAHLALLWAIVRFNLLDKIGI